MPISILPCVSLQHTCIYHWSSRARFSTAVAAAEYHAFASARSGTLEATCRVVVHSFSPVQSESQASLAAPKLPDTLISGCASVPPPERREIASESPVLSRPGGEMKSQARATERERLSGSRSCPRVSYVVLEAGQESFVISWNPSCSAWPSAQDLTSRVSASWLGWRSAVAMHITRCRVAMASYRGSHPSHHPAPSPPSARIRAASSGQNATEPLRGYHPVVTGGGIGPRAEGGYWRFGPRHPAGGNSGK